MLFYITIDNKFELWFISCNKVCAVIINKIPLIRKSLNIQPGFEGDMWKDEEYLKKTASQTFWDYPRVRIGQVGIVGFSSVLPPSVGFVFDGICAGNLGVVMLGSLALLWVGFGIHGCVNIMTDGDGWSNYIHKIEAKDCLKKINQKKKLAMNQDKQNILVNEK